jgi:Ca2+-binding RTX toxin-like protein
LGAGQYAIDSDDGPLNDRTGSASNDVIAGEDVDGNALSGLGGNDVLFGNSGSDTLNGGLGSDLLLGGFGADKFDYNAIADSGVGAGNRDVIADFEGAGAAGGDDIDLADLFAGTFAVVAAPAVGVGELVLDTTSVVGSTIVKGYTDGAGGEDFQIEVAGVTTLTAADFIL